MPHDSPILPGLSPVDGRDLQARFDGGALSSDGGALLLREIERKMRLSDVLASCLADRRDPARTQHSFTSMIRARVMAIACGYEDCDDMDTRIGLWPETPGIINAGSHLPQPYAGFLGSSRSATWT